jgi:arylsulfatase A-like enzyme
MFRRRLNPAAFAIAAVAGALAFVTPATAAARAPNIIFILADDLGYGDLGCYGQQQIRTPHLDQLAVDGMRFTSAYAGSTVCAPSRAVLMTGRHTGHVHIRGNSRQQHPLRPRDKTVAELLKRAGYRTAVIGKWGLGDAGSTGVPNKKGFDEWFGYLTHGHAHDYHPEFLWRNENKFVLDVNLEGRKGEYTPDWFTKAALNFIRDNWDRPFFLYLACTIPHANNELGRATGNGMEVPSDEPYSDKDWPQPEKNKAAMISRLDHDVGRLIARLKELRIDRHTVVFFSSDNGPHKEGGVNPEFFKSSGPLRGIKRDLYEGGIRVPMIVSWPGTIKAGTVSDFPWAFWDFLPTACELAGVSPPTDIDGQSILPTLKGGTQKPHEFLYWEYHERGFHQAVRMGDWKLVVPGLGAPPQLFNLSRDPGEQHDVAVLFTDELIKMETYLNTARTESDLWPVDRSLPWMKTGKPAGKSK